MTSETPGPSTPPPRSDVAIVVVCYNQGHFLSDALESVLSQSLPADEIVLVDDGSTDDTAAIAASFPSIRYLRQDNAGLSAARNAGLRAVTSPFVLFLDADDRLHPGAIAAALPTLKADRSRALVYGGYREVSETLQTLSVHRPTEHPDAFEGLLRHANHIAMHGTVLYDAARLRDAGGFDEGLRSCEDYDVYLRLARRHAIAAYPIIAADYRRHGRSMSGARLRMIDTADRVLNRHVSNTREMRSARQGRDVFASFYGEPIFHNLITLLLRRSFRELASLLADVARRPALRRFIVVRSLRAARRRLVPGRTVSD